MAAVSADVPKSTIFVSYSRADAAFASEVAKGLRFDGSFNVTLDVDSIEEGEGWRARLGALIEEADTVVFVLSPSSAKSKICNWEVEHAHERSKRIIPVLWIDPGAEPAPEKLSALHYVRFDGGRSFMDGLVALLDALKSDLDWLREHTRLLGRALEWERSKRSNDRLLVGESLASAKDWAARRPKNAPDLTELHLAYFNASEGEQEARTRKERDRVLELERALKEAETARRDAEAAQALAEAAQQQTIEQSKRVFRRTASGLVVALVLMGVAGVFGLKARQEAARADKEAAAAVAANKGLDAKVAELEATERG